MAEIRVGVSGWSYRHWRRRFYPEGLPQRRELEYASARFGSIEINGTFYGLTRASTVRNWHAQTPADFVFAVKGSRFITHNKKLADPEAARRLARHHDERVGDPGFGPEGRRTIRHALEIRHPSFFSAEAVDIVRRHGVALAVSHSAAWEYTEEVTADFVYVRLHGPRALYDSRYRPDELAHWAERVRRWHAGRQPVDARRITSLPLPSRRKRDVFLYFDNDGHAYAPEQALEMQRLLGLDQGPTEESGA